MVKYAYENGGQISSNLATVIRHVLGGTQKKHEKLVTVASILMTAKQSQLQEILRKRFILELTKKYV
jgi:hypothetical protein